MVTIFTSEMKGDRDGKSAKKEYNKILPAVVVNDHMYISPSMPRVYAGIMGQ